MGKAKDVMMGRGLRFLNLVAGLSVIDKAGVREPAEALLYQGAKTALQTAGAVSRTFAATRKLLQPARLASRDASDLFDLTPTDEQQMLADAVATFATEKLRPDALGADTDCKPRGALLAEAATLGIGLMAIPEEFGGAGSDRSPITQALVAEAMAKGDLGLAYACLAPGAVSTALTLWGDAEQQARYLPAFCSDKPPAAALAIQEPQPLFDPFRLQTRARIEGEHYVLDGVKALVPLAAQAELFIVAAELAEHGPALFVIESNTPGLAIEPEPAMGLRAAATGRLLLRDVRLKGDALLGEGTAEMYADCIALSRIAWAALAAGCGRAALDYLIPYVNERKAFGEPISHRQAVAFAIANLAIELDGIRLLMLRAASRAERGEPFAAEAALAKQFAADKGVLIGSEAVQLLGGHGFVKEHPAERWYRDLRAIGLVEGGLLI